MNDKQRTLKQIRTLDPISKREWYNVNKTYNIFFSALDIAENESISDALYKPLKGETYRDVIGYENVNDGDYRYKVQLIDTDNYPRGGVYYDFEVDEDTELKLTYDSTSNFQVTPGRASIFNMYFESNVTVNIDVTDPLSYVDSTGGYDSTNTTLVVLLGMLSPIVEEKVEVEVGIIPIEDYVRWLYNETTSDFQASSLILGFVELDEYGLISGPESILRNKSVIVDLYDGLGPITYDFERELLDGGFDRYNVNAGVVLETGVQFDW